MWSDIKHRYSPINDQGFFACIDSNGFWFDSATNFIVAVHWCAMHFGEYNLEVEEELARINHYGYSIIHSSLLEKLADAGIIS